VVLTYSLESDIEGKTVEEAREIVRKRIEEIRITDTRKEWLSERIKGLIMYNIERSDYYEGYRTRYLTLSAQLIAFSVAFVSLVTTFVSPTPFLMLFGATILLILCIFNVVLYLKESVFPGYVHRSVSDVPWYYRYNLKRWNKEKSMYLGKRDDQTKDYLLDLYDNERRRIFETEDAAIKGDIEQLTILYVITSYKVRFSDRMQQILSFALLSFGIFSACQLVLFALRFFTMG